MAKNQEPPDEQEATPEPLDFERALARLEEVVHLLEDGQLGLGESLSRYEEGVKLLRRAYDLLEKAERRIELLSGVDAEGNPITRPVADVSTVSLEEKKGRRGRPQ